MLKLKKEIKCGAIIVARLKSKRLKNKALLKIDKKNSIIEYIIIKIKKFFENNRIILATSHKKSDIILSLIAKKHNISSFQGEAIDVLKRIYLASKNKYFANVFIVTGDNPMFDINIAKKMINYHLKFNNDFTYANDLPFGTYGWVLKVKSIKKILLKKKRKDTEIWGDYFLENKNIKCAKISFKEKNILQNLRLTIDKKPDLKLVRKILSISKVKFPSFDKVQRILIKNKKILNINSNVKQKKKPKKIY